jgi:predicted proteasome-type protease
LNRDYRWWAGLAVAQNQGLTGHEMQRWMIAVFNTAIGTGRSNYVSWTDFERIGRRALVLVAAGALLIGVAASSAGYARVAPWIWGIGTAPVAAGLLVSMIREIMAGRVGVDAIALVSMSAALLLGETLAGVVVAIKYAGGQRLGGLRRRAGSART